MEEIDENSLEWARKFKKYLSFDVGEIVYLKSDIKKACPMTIEKIFSQSEYEDYSAIYQKSAKNISQICLIDKTLCQ
jgi:hypothetical protein